MTGQILGNYKILTQAGEGSMGAVHHAVDLMLDREVALKALRPELTSRADVVARFREEARVQARLNHPNVAQLYSLFSHGNDLFMVMEFVKGPTLDNIIRHVGRMRLDQALPIFLQVLDGVDHAHRMGIIHRDLKPANIMIAQDGLVKVTDFGIARVLGTARVTREGVMIGTLEYMSPEAILGRDMDARSDLYSLGFVFFEMLNGSPPFTGGTEYELMLAQVETPPPPIGSCVPDVHPEIEAAILKAMQKNPDDRYSSVAEFAAALRKLAADMPAVGSFTIALAQNFLSGEASSELRGPAGETRLAAASVSAVSSAAPSATSLRALAHAQKTRLKYFIVAIVVVSALTAWFVIGGIPAKKQPVAERPSIAPAVTADNPPPTVSASKGPHEEAAPSLAIPPKIANFTADAQTVKPGQEVHLQWSVTGDVRAVALNPGGNLPKGATTYVVRPTETTLFKLIARGASANAESTLSVQVIPYVRPVIGQFDGEPKTVTQGQSTRLAWSVDGDINKISVTPGPPISVGSTSVEVSPQKPTTYKLEISGPAGTDSKIVTIEVADRTVSTPSVPASLANSSGEAEQTYAEAQIAHKAKRYADAIALLGKAAKLKPGWSDPLVERAQLDVKLGRYPDAIEDSNEALRLNPNDAVTLNMRGLARSSVNQNREAITDFDEAIRLKPDYSDAYKNRGNAKWALGDKEGAQADFDAAHSLQKRGES